MPFRQRRVQPGCCRKSRQICESFATTAACGSPLGPAVSFQEGLHEHLSLGRRFDHRRPHGRQPNRTARVASSSPGRHGQSARGGGCGRALGHGNAPFGDRSQPDRPTLRTPVTSRPCKRARRSTASIIPRRPSARRGAWSRAGLPITSRKPDLTRCPNATDTRYRRTQPAWPGAIEPSTLVAAFRYVAAYPSSRGRQCKPVRRRSGWRSL
jgi:hypothetical protein